jgi:radical SAM protein with 4Fe4S-binding SPASM domain
MPHCNKQMLSFFLTTKCRLRCTYCYNQEAREKLEEKSLPLEIAKAGIDDYFSNNKSRHIRFYGPGEPTEEFELMQQITDYARQNAGIITTELQTNGTFNQEVRDWILDNINIVWISFDGTPEIHDKQRPFPNYEPSSPIIEENIRWLLNKKGERNLMIGGRVTITDLNNSNEDHKQMVDYFKNMGINYIWSDPEFPPVGDRPFYDDKKAQEKYHFDMDTYVKNYIEAYRYAKKIGIFYGSFLICNFDSVTKINCRCCTPVPHLTPDGYVSACDLVIFGASANHMDCFIYGEFDKFTKKFIYYPEKIKALRDRNTDNITHCKSCPAKLHCSGYCPGEVVNETGKLDGIKPHACKAVRKLYNELYKEIKKDLKGGLYPYPHP